MSLSAAFAAGINLNTATQAELEALPGVGSKLAAEIVKARPFKSVDDLNNVKGVGDAKFKKLKELVNVEGSSAPAAPAAATAPAVTQSVGSVVSKAVSRGSTAASKALGSERINLNTASQADLERLPGIGEKKAQAIIAARPFKAPEDIMKVKGIKEGIFKKIQNNISVN